VTKLKDKLSASVRMAKAAQQSAAEQPAPEQPAAAPATTAKPRTRTTAPARPSAAPAKAPARKPAPGGEIPESGSALFPKRVWPD
jgi:hypothetical protein